MTTVVELHKALTVEWAKMPQNLKNVGAALAKLTAALESGDANAMKGFEPERANILRRDMLEVTAMCALRAGAFDKFDEAMVELRAHYRISGLDSPQKSQLLGLDLMNKLASDKMKASAPVPPIEWLQEFHLTMCEYEYAARQKDVFLAFPEKLEENLSTGFYTRIEQMKHSTPSNDYKLFFDKLMHTARDRMARSIETAYPSIGVSAATSLLFEPSEAATLEYAAERRWVHSGTEFVFPQVGEPRSAAQHEAMSVNTKQLIVANLDYAKQLEKIV